LVTSAESPKEARKPSGDVVVGVWLVTVARARACARVYPWFDGVMPISDSQTIKIRGECLMTACSIFGCNVRFLLMV
jgi:hypothetical protein